MRGWMTRALAIGLVAAALMTPEVVRADGPAPWGHVQVVPLWRAVETGLVEASGKDPRSYRQVDLTVQSRAKKRVIVDYGGSHLRPKQSGACQRLGLGPPVVAHIDEDNPPLATLRLEPGETQTVLVNTVCLDVRRKAPREQTFSGARAKLPAARRKILQWWVKNPAASQSSVNSAIWRNSSSVTVHEWGDLSARSETIRTAAVHGGIYYQVKHHRLTSLDPDGVRRVLGSEIERVFPTDDSVYATMPGDDGVMDLWRLAPTGKNPWSFVADLDPTWEIRELIPRSRGEFVLVTKTGVQWFLRESRSFQNVFPITESQHLSARVGPRTGSLYITTHTAADPGTPQRDGEIEGAQAPTFEYWRIDSKTRKAEKRKTFWNVAAIRAGPAGVFGLSPAGQLRRMKGGKFKDMQSNRTYAAIVRVGRERVWMSTDKGNLVAVSPTTGKRLFGSDARITKETWLEWDAKTDELAYTDRNSFRRISAENGRSVQVPETDDDE